MARRTLLLLATAVVLPLGAAASCSDDGPSDGGGAGRAEQISEALQQDGVPEDTADCLGTAFVDGGLTEEETDLDDVATLSEAERQVVNEALSTCAGGDVTLPE